MSVVVTGAAGFIGRALTPRLLAARHDVVAIDRVPQDDQAGVSVLTADLLDADPLVEVALSEADAVVHLAGCSGVRDSTPGVDRRRHRDNVEATQVVADLVRADAPLVVASSSSVYGGARFGRACREADVLDPRGGYARSKVATENVCGRRLAAGGHTLAVRPFTVVGEGQRADMALSRWADAALSGDLVRVFGSLERTRDLTCVREVARGLVALVEVGATGLVNLGSGRPRTLGEVVHALAVVLDVDADVVVEPAAHFEVASTWADTQRFEALAGFRPHTDLLDVVRRFAQAHRAAALPAAAATSVAVAG